MSFHDFSLGLPRPAVCSHLRDVFTTVWDVTLNEALKNLFENSDALSASKELHTQLLQALPPNKQQLLTMMELITFLGDANQLKTIMNDYQKVLGKEGVKVDQLKSKIHEAFGSISPVYLKLLLIFIFNKPKDSFLRIPR